MISSYTENYSTKPKGRVMISCNACRRAFPTAQGFRGKDRARARAIERLEHLLKEEGWACEGDHHYCDTCKGPVVLIETEAARISKLVGRTEDLEHALEKALAEIED